MVEPTPESLGAARLALATAWCAVVGDAAAFDPPRFTWSGVLDARDVREAAAYLAQRTKPCCRTPATRALVLTGGRALRAARGAFDRFCADYVLETRGVAAGGLLDGPWATNLALPGPWLDGVSFV